jgi:phosphoglycolate phosphatase
MVRIMLPKLGITDSEIPDNLKSDITSSEKLEFDARAFIFDKDGTLLSHDHFIPIMEKRIELLTEMFNLSKDDISKLTRILGLDPDTKKIIPHGTMFIARADTKLLVEAFLTDKGFNFSKVKQQVSKVFFDADELVELKNYIKPFPDVPEFLKKFKSHDVKIAVATHDTTAAALKHLSLADLNQYLDLIIGLDYHESVQHKPSPTMLEIACNEFNLKPSDAVVVGDSINDVLMGKNGGAGLSVAVLTGEHQIDDFKDYDAIISTLSQIEILD